MKPLAYAALHVLAALASLSESGGQTDPAARPNVILIYTDDQGSLDLGCYGADDLITPHLDALARRGLRFTQMYAPSAICSASRAGLLTGRLPARAGVPGNVSSAQGSPGMPTEEVTIAEMLEGSGYHTAHVGKWHLGYTPETMPNGQGFSQSFGHMGGCIDNYSHFFYWNGPNRHDLWENGTEIWRDGEYFGDLMVSEAIEVIRRDSRQPFFLYWAINMPHYPMQAPAKWRHAYRHLPSPRRQYAAFVSTVDEMIGEVLGALEGQGLTENTIVIFQSDHGHSTEERAFFGGGHAGPYRGAKGCLFEGGLRVPAIISWPAQLPQNEVRGHMVTGMDWFPTLQDLCQAAPPESRSLDGKSLVPVLSDPSTATPHQSLYWQLGTGDQAQWAVRRGPWKLLGNPRDTTLQEGPRSLTDPLFLAHLEEDPGERSNRADAEPDLVQELLGIRQEHSRSLP